MSDQPKADIMMAFFDKKGNPVRGEGMHDKHPNDSLMEEFEPATADAYSNYFELKNFSFAAKVRDEDANKANKQQNGRSATGSAVANAHVHGQPAGSAVAGRQGGVEPKKKGLGEFASWRSATDDEVRKNKMPMFPFGFDSFTITRLIDAASIRFFEACCNSITFEKAILVKRLTLGAAAAKSKMLGMAYAQSFLRIEFRDVLITGIDWDDGDLVDEKLTFRVRQGVEMRYKAQNFSGELSPVQRPVSWDRDRDALPKSRRDS